MDETSVQARGLVPPVQYTVRSKQGFRSFRGTSPQALQIQDLSGPENGGLEYSRDGQKLAVLDSTGIIIYDSNSGARISRVERTGINAFGFSPLGTFLVTWERMKEEGSSPAPPGEGAKGSGPQLNLLVFDVSKGAQIAGFSQKSFSKENWPALRWTDDEAIAARSVTNEVHFFDGKNLGGGTIERLRLTGLSKFEIAPGPIAHVAIYVPEIKGTPARVSIFKYGQFGDGQAVATKSFFKADKTDLKWNSSGTAVLVNTQTDVDASGKSYYGETGLFFLHVNGNVQNVTLDKEGPIHDVQWNPNGKEFIVLYGFMPAKGILFNWECKPIFDFGARPRNAILWSPHGRFLCLGGFGNLQGDMDFWDRYKLKCIGSSSASCAVYQAWSPDSRLFLAATLFPRLRVDNNYKIFKYDGTLISTEKGDEIYQVTWRPAAAGIYPDRGQSPKPRSSDSPLAPSSSNGSALPPTVSPAKPGVYRHPHASSVASTIVVRQDEAPGGKIKSAAPAKAVPVGVTQEDMDKAALKNKKKREAKKKKKEDGDGGDDVAGADEETAKLTTAAVSQPSPNASKQQQQQQQQQPAPSPTVISTKAIPPSQPQAPQASRPPVAASSSVKPSQIPAPSPPAISSKDADEQEKKVRALQKKLRQVEELKEAKAAGKQLEKLQLEKIATESSLRSEIAALQQR
mmetsp:Transcript_55190/g.91747  ORF Transcript_55190/g.91747 Transcript_55190/m.91747 type:complete len:684 (+) Transcript_55190:54-2105(+)